MRYQLTDIEKIMTEQLHDYEIKVDRQEDKMTIQHSNGGCVTVSLRTLLAKANEQENLKNIDEAIYYITTSLTANANDAQVILDLSRVFPVIRATSFPKETKKGVPFIITEHTAETAIYYALDLGKTYRLIDETLLHQANITATQLQEAAISNLKQLPISLATEQVVGNTFYFVNNKDGYDSARVLNYEWLNALTAEFTGEALVAIPHQDTLIIGDIVNEAGYDIISKLAIHYFTEGLVPITSMTFNYDNHQLTPLFILVQDRPKSTKN